METHTENIDSFSRIKSSNTKMCEILREITYIRNQHTLGPFTHQQQISLNPVCLKFEDTAFVVKFLSVCSDISQYFNLITIVLWCSPCERLCRWCVYVADIWEVYLKVSPAIRCLFPYLNIFLLISFLLSQQRPRWGYQTHKRTTRTFLSSSLCGLSHYIYSKQTSERDQVRRAV